MSDRYPPGTRVVWKNTMVTGTVIECSEGIAVHWDGDGLGHISRFDEWYMDEMMKITRKGPE